MSKFMQVYQPVEEGWGTALGRVAKITGLAVNQVAGNAMMTALKAGNAAKTISNAKTMLAGSGVLWGGVALGKIIGTISNANLSKLLKNPKMQKYLVQACDKLYKEEKAKDKSITAKLPSDPITMIKRWWHNNDEVGFFSKPNFLMQHDDLIDDSVFDLSVGTYTTTFWYDTEDITAAVVMFYSQDKDKIVGRRLPAPTDKELRQMFHD